MNKKIIQIIIPVCCFGVGVVVGNNLKKKPNDILGNLRIDNSADGINLFLEITNQNILNNKKQASINIIHQSYVKRNINNHLNEQEE